MGNNRLNKIRGNDKEYDRVYTVKQRVELQDSQADKRGKTKSKAVFHVEYYSDRKTVFGMIGWNRCVFFNKYVKLRDAEKAWDKMFDKGMYKGCQGHWRLVDGKGNVYKERINIL